MIKYFTILLAFVLTLASCGNTEVNDNVVSEDTSSDTTDTSKNDGTYVKDPNIEPNVTLTGVITNGPHVP